ncbi:MAG: phosphatase PAP2 family protein [Actinomycetota bacterium]
MSPRRAQLATAALAAAGGLASARFASRHTVGPREERVFRSANDAPGGLHLPVWAIMQSGSLGAVLVVSSLRCRSAGGERQAAITALVGTGVWGGVKLLKPLVGRGRPDQHLDGVRVRGHAQSGLGYPSGHAAVSLTLALVSTRGRPPAERATALCLAAATGWARMYVGAHLPLDIVGGFAVGCLSGEAARLLADATAR